MARYKEGRFLYAIESLKEAGYHIICEPSTIQILTPAWERITARAREGYMDVVAYSLFPDDHLSSLIALFEEAAKERSLHTVGTTFYDPLLSPHQIASSLEPFGFSPGQEHPDYLSLRPVHPFNMIFSRSYIKILDPSPFLYASDAYDEIKKGLPFVLNEIFHVHGFRSTPPTLSFDAVCYGKNVTFSYIHARKQLTVMNKKCVLSTEENVMTDALRELIRQLKETQQLRLLLKGEEE